MLNVRSFSFDYVPFFLSSVLRFCSLFPVAPVLCLKSLFHVSSPLSQVFVPCLSSSVPCLT